MPIPCAKAIAALLCFATLPAAAPDISDDATINLRYRVPTLFGHPDVSLDTGRECLTVISIKNYIEQVIASSSRRDFDIAAM